MRYLVEVFWSDEDEGYIATVPDLPGCSAFGATPEEAVREVQDAAAAWIAAGLGTRPRCIPTARPTRVGIEACRAAGDPVPEPATRARRAAA